MPCRSRASKHEDEGLLVFTFMSMPLTLGIRSCYDEGKRAAETLFFDFHRQNSIPAPMDP